MQVPLLHELCTDYIHKVALDTTIFLHQKESFSTFFLFWQNKWFRMQNKYEHPMTFSENSLAKQHNFLTFKNDKFQQTVLDTRWTGMVTYQPIASIASCLYLGFSPTLELETGVDFRIRRNHWLKILTKDFSLSSAATRLPIILCNRLTLLEDPKAFLNLLLRRNYTRLCWNETFNWFNRCLLLNKK